jgi:HK97 family phage portal protein
VGWLTPPVAKASQTLAVRDGRQGVMMIDAYGAGRPNLAGALEPDGSYANYTQNGYGRNELVYACIRYRAESLPQAILRVYPVGGATPIDDHRLRLLFEEPNPVTTELEFFEMSSTYKDLAGTCFWLVVNGRDQIPSQLWPLQPNLVGVLPDPKDPSNYVWIYRPNPERPDIWVPIPDAGSPLARTSQTSIIRIRYPNPNPHDPGAAFFGMPPLRPAARAVTLDNGATDFVDSLLRNHAMPSAIIESEAEVTDTISKRLSTIWTNAFGGPRRGRPAFLQKGMKVHTLGLTLPELAFPELDAVSETRICMAFAVEPILVGAKVGLEHNAYKDYREARLSFWEETMFTEMRRYLDPAKRRLLPRFQGAGRRRLRLAWDTSEVLALKEAQTSQWERATNALARGGITRNDFRTLVGLATVPGGDVFLTPAGVIPQEVGEDLAVTAETVSASIGLLAAEYGLELSDHELELLHARVGVEG